MNKDNQLGLVACLAKKWGPTNKLGRKAFQKVVHIATELGEVPTGYHFSFYTYGPYSRELAADLEFAEVIGGVSSSQDPATGAFDIKAGAIAESLIKDSSDYLNTYNAMLDAIFDNFAGQTAKSLELYSTLIFLEKREPQASEFESNIKTKIRQLKPKYTESEISTAFRKLQDISKSLEKVSG